MTRFDTLENTDVLNLTTLNVVDTLSYYDYNNEEHKGFIDKI